MNIPDLKTITPNQSRECQIRKNFPEFSKMIDENTSLPDLPFKERAWLYLNGLTEAPKCPVCGGPVKFISITNGYATACSKACSNKNPKKIQKTKDNNFQKYGVTSVVKLPEIQEKMKKTCLERYGVENAQQNKEIREKSNKTYIERHGGIGNASESVKAKQRQTMLERYGIENSMHSEEVKNKLKGTLLEKYGFDSTFKIPEVKEKIKKTMLERYGVETPIQNEEIKRKISNTIKERYGAEWFCQTKEYNSALSNNSKPNQNFAALLDKYGVVYEREYSIENRRYDFKVNNTLIEIDPSATHNSTYGIKGKNPTPKSYHLEKTELAKKHNFHCIHVWDWDNLDLIARSFMLKNTVYARQCEVVDVSKEDAIKFLNENHLQGACNGLIENIGLMKDGELLGIMCFGKPRYNRNFKKELLRLCFRTDVLVIGGSEKMFSHYIEKYDPKSIISYCDISKFDGKVYDRLGFRLARKGRPSLHWWNGKLHIRHSMLLQLGFDKIFGTDFGKGTSNEFLMLDHKFVEIWDCGQDTYTYRKSDHD